MQHPSSSAAFPKPDYMHWTGIALVFIACGVASIKPLEFASYILHQVGTLIGLIALLVFTFKGWVSRSGALPGA